MNKKYWDVIGIMSGTSLDGVDIVYTRISTMNEIYDFNIKKSVTVPYSDEWEQKLMRAFSSTRNQIDELNISYGEYLGDLVNAFIKEYRISYIDLIASHGHTIFHKPQEGFTLQIGDGQTICNRTGFRVICDFRTQDVAIGGQGAPLVPIGDRLLFSQFDYCLNLGGFANISFEEGRERIAFDICPVNIVLNYYARKMGLDYDRDGKIARKGKIDEDLLKKLNELRFYSSPIPKSLGFEFVEEEIIPLIENSHLKIEDILRTFVAHIVTQISTCLAGDDKSKVMVTGGGALNVFLMDELKRRTKKEIVIPSAKIINYKEALIFALLGVLRSENKVNCLRSVTGAERDHSSGKIFVKTD